MKKLQQEKLLINLEKCTFMQEELVYLGFIVSREGLKCWVWSLIIFLVFRGLFSARFGPHTLIGGCGEAFPPL